MSQGLSQWMSNSASLRSRSLLILQTLKSLFLSAVFIIISLIALRRISLSSQRPNLKTRSLFPDKEFAQHHP
ncbi:hypothetical protein PHYBLDRAFT_141802 [Phycomyces blakesleeanus NRRL 1555(-)]|uniref:Uncharacterized protein n=1 Tax=Phycomyces blakesleeanus (strain ATCC 8743b / DSM 1359 / FGSC 10004 / NBRC 33097 / NRRL 1555) TaxID=763407 RepID=A0A162UTI7_PHYB8|nr:hypothetical protein PHYBLDRAFT_141802 [Phycomyces blakesleeanus NRRL 1555(-)]OAD77942.1 hypothetical protein PHYBLDRAFT_141802 [Phycomyces blakesleeanus NRRL 1555(-)]|eukprot:XP_018295982.1 hypothetical protein PHYBLDRAFT_141802 [Phycomyces blakesleeanus NRRL 1555(-)]